MYKQQGQLYGIEDLDVQAMEKLRIKIEEQRKKRKVGRGPFRQAEQHEQSCIYLENKNRHINCVFFRDFGNILTLQFYPGPPLFGPSPYSFLTYECVCSHARP
jgi:hypothetical protein